MSRNGGKRPGAGRPKGAVNKVIRLKDEARIALENKVIANWDKILSTLLTVGLGEYKIENSRGIVYQKQPDPDTLFKLIEYAAGKPSAGDGSALPIGDGNSLGDRLAQILNKPSVQFVQNNTSNVQINNGGVVKHSQPSPSPAKTYNFAPAPKVPHIPIPLVEQSNDGPQPAFPDLLPNSMNNRIRPAAPGVVPQSKVLTPEAVLG